MFKPDPNFTRHADGRGGTWIPYHIWRGKDIDQRPVGERWKELREWAGRQQGKSLVATRQYADAFWGQALLIIRILMRERQLVDSEIPVEAILVENEELRARLAAELRHSDAENKRDEYHDALERFVAATVFLGLPEDQWADLPVLARMERERVIALHPEFANSPPVRNPHRAGEGAEPPSDPPVLSQSGGGSKLMDGK